MTAPCRQRCHRYVQVNRPTGLLRKEVSRSVELRTPSFSMSAGRYVSTGFGPVSSAVGMFEPVTITRSISAWPGTVAGGAPAGAGN